MKKYGLRDAKAILGKHYDRSLSADESGLNLAPSLSEDDQLRGLCWKYVLELDGGDGVNMLDAPCLPIPFTVNQLAAFMLDGVGAILPSVYGSWHRTNKDESALAPDEEMLNGILGGDTARDAREALRLAYASILDAQTVVGEYPWELQSRADTLAAAYRDIVNQAHKNERAVYELEATSEATLSQHAAQLQRKAHQIAARERVNFQMADAKAECDQAKQDYEKSFSQWRKAMVNQLLGSEIARQVKSDDEGQPQDVTADDETELEDAEQIPWHLLATSSELIAAFGTRTGMDKTWFKKLSDKPELLAARYSPGKGGRNRIEPYFYVFRVMTWLIDPKRRTGRQMDEATGWRMLRNQFPAVYAEFQEQDPTID